MFEEWDDIDFSNCPECKISFNSAFDAVEHFLEDDEEFDPAMILPGGYRLMIGSLMRGIYENRDNPNYIKEIAESTYGILFMAEFNSGTIKNVVEDIIVDTEMENFDVQLRSLFKNGE